MRRKNNTKSLFLSKTAFAHMVVAEKCNSYLCLNHTTPIFLMVTPMRRSHVFHVCNMVLLLPSVSQAQNHSHDCGQQEHEDQISDCWQEGMKQELYWWLVNVIVWIRKNNNVWQIAIKFISFCLDHEAFFLPTRARLWTPVFYCRFRDWRTSCLRSISDAMKNLARYFNLNL